MIEVLDNQTGDRYIVNVSSQYKNDGLSAYSVNLIKPYAEEYWDNFLDFPVNKDGFQHYYGLIRYSVALLRESHPEVQIAYSETSDENLARKFSHVLIGLKEVPIKPNIEAIFLWNSIMAWFADSNKLPGDPKNIGYPGNFKKLLD